jgi:hypothetical protein
MLRPGRLWRTHVRSGIAAQRRPLADDVRAENPVVVKRPVHGDRLLVILPQVDLLLRKLAFFARARQTQNHVGIFQKTQTIRAIDHYHFAGKDFGFALEFGGRLLRRSARLF